MREVVHGTRSNKGLENHSVLRSLFETARRQGKKAQTFFFDLFTKDTAQAQAALYRGNLPKRAKPATQPNKQKTTVTNRQTITPPQVKHHLPLS